MEAVAAGYAPVELDMDTGRRGRRALVVRVVDPRGRLVEVAGRRAALQLGRRALALLAGLHETDLDRALAR